MTTLEVQTPTAAAIPVRTDAPETSGYLAIHEAMRVANQQLLDGLANADVHDPKRAAAIARWFRGYSDELRTHHHIEDESFWPVLLAHATNDQDRSTLEAMEAEHAVIDPALAACRSAFATMKQDPTDEHRHALFLLVTALRDGMNLVAKEYVAAQDGADPGVLVLSRFAGAAQELDGALLVNPHDIAATAAAIAAALTMPPDERVARWRAMYDHLVANDVVRWRGTFLGALERPCPPLRRVV